MTSTAVGWWGSLKQWVQENYADLIDSLKQAVRVAYVVFAFCSALFIGALKGILVGPIAGLLLILGNVGVILALFPAQVTWTVYSFVKTNRINAALKFAIIFALPILFCLWLVLSIFGSVLVGIGYGFFTPWVSTFEAFRHKGEAKKFLHSIVDGTWGTIKGSCTVVRDFADFCYHSYPLYLKELRESTSDHQTLSIRLSEVPACIVVGLMGLVVDVPLYTVIALLKSPFMLFKGWQRLLHDLITREGCVILAIVSSIFVGLYGSVIVFQERSFKKGVAYVVAVVAKFDEYTNDWLYLREGSFLPKPRYRKSKVSHSAENSVQKGKTNGGSGPLEAPAMFMSSLAPSRSVRETIQEVKMVQIWEDLMKCSEMRGKELVDAKIVTAVQLTEWLKAKESNQDLVSLGLPSYAFLHCLLYSVKAGSIGLLLSGGVEVTQQNRPQDRLLDWFFHPVMVLKEQIRVISLQEEEVRFLEKLVLFNGDGLSMQSWENGSIVPEDALREAQIQAISRRLVGMTRTISKFPTYRRKYRQVVKILITYCHEKDGPLLMRSTRSGSSVEIVLDV
ncbi:hypothetical protein HPP92_016381 [Vanilla planifolia]|uniref:Uncharacterized protein n=1 Tax=Vanilla planifolia TaxID=51239 RepID=A0A835QF51_VANPL|nr:hypothetical protein HPP92_016381 [Vanilla planifolia]